MLSLRDRIELLEADLTAQPININVYQDLPFAILRYEPEDEWSMRQQVQLLVTRIEGNGKRGQVISLADMLWQAIDRSEGMDVLVEMEQMYGFEMAQAQVSTYLSDRDFCPLADLLAERLHPLDPQHDIALLVRAAAFAPSIYHMSKLLDEMHGRTRVPSVLFYPGTREGETGLRYMGLKDRETLGNYRVKVYA